MGFVLPRLRHRLRPLSSTGKILHLCAQVGDGGVAIFMCDRGCDYDARPIVASVPPRDGTVDTNVDYVRLALTVSDPDCVCEKMVAAGASVIMPIADQFWGARYGIVQVSQCVPRV